MAGSLVRGQRTQPRRLQRKKGVGFRDQRAKSLQVAVMNCASTRCTIILVLAGRVTHNANYKEL